MNDLTIPGLGTISEIVENIDNYPVEVKVVVYDVLEEMTRRIKEKREYVKEKLILEMRKENQTKELFISSDGKKKILSMREGTPVPVNDAKKTVEVWCKHGYLSEDIGEFTFKPSWSKAKEQRKFGGEKQLLIDELFRSISPVITIKEASDGK